MKLTNKILEEFQFKNRPGNSFENINLPYWVRNSILLFYNEGQEEYAYLIGYGFTAGMMPSKYYAATFRWIHTFEELEAIYNSILRKDINDKDPDYSKHLQEN